MTNSINALSRNEIKDRPLKFSNEWADETKNFPNYILVLDFDRIKLFDPNEDKAHEFPVSKHTIN